MNSEMKELEQLVQYLDGELNEVEKQQLVQKLKIDPTLSEKLDLIKDVDKLIGDYQLTSFEDSLKEVQSQYEHSKQAKKTSKKLFLLSTAAIITIVISVAFFFIYQHSHFSKNLDKVYAAYYEKLPADFATRSEQNNDDFLDAINLYNENKYQEAIIAFGKIVKKDPTNNAAKLFLGICYSELNQYNNAVSEFKEIVENKDGLFEEHAAWYLSLCYVKINNQKLAKQLLTNLVSSRSFYMLKASDLLKELP